jgi:hypothetical protein
VQHFRAYAHEEGPSTSLTHCGAMFSHQPGLYWHPAFELHCRAAQVLRCVAGVVYLETVYWDPLDDVTPQQSVPGGRQSQGHRCFHGTRHSPGPWSCFT